MGSTTDLNDELMVQFQMFPNFYRPINDNEKRITGVKFSHDGEKLVAISNRFTLDVYNCNTAQRETYVDLQKHGISTFGFMDTNDTVLIGSVGRIRYDFALRELNLVKKQYGTCYFGHVAPVKSLAINTKKNYFISGGHDKMALLFDIRNPTAQISCTDLSEPPLVALHPTTDICALALDSNRIELYDIRAMNFGPFAVLKLNVDHVKWTSLKFSPNGKQLLISSNTSKIRLINSVSGVVQDVFGSKFVCCPSLFAVCVIVISSFSLSVCFSKGRKNTLNIPIDASFTPNSEYILSGSSDGNVVIFSNKKREQYKSQPTDRERKLAELQSLQPEAITAVEMNPKYSLMVTASSYVAFWAPNTQ